MNNTELLRRLTEHDYTVFEEQTAHHLSASGALKPIILKNEQDKALEKLQLVSDFDHFYFVTNIQTNELGESHGIKKFLRYPDEDFTMRKYLGIIHPIHLLPRNLFVYFWREQLLAGNFRMRFMDHRLITRVAVKHKDGHYVLLKYLSFAFQMDPHDRVIEYMNLATVLHDYNHEPYSMLMQDSSGSPMAEWENKIKSDVREAFLNGGLFSDMQAEILRYIAKTKDADFTLADVATGLHEHEEHIKTQCRRAKDKINDLFKTDFKGTRAAFAFLLTQGLI